MQEEFFPAPTEKANRTDWFFYLSNGVLVLLFIAWFWFTPALLQAYEQWTDRPPEDPYRVLPPNRFTLSEVFWFSWVGAFPPQGPLLREMPAVAIVAGYLFLLPIVLLLLLKFLLGLVSARPFRTFRYYPLTVALLILAYVPLWICLREWLNLKYAIWVPEYFFAF
jgi:hypothetical protein